MTLHGRKKTAVESILYQVRMQSIIFFYGLSCIVSNESFLAMWTIQIDRTHVLGYRLLGRRSDPPGVEPCRCLTSPDSNRNIEEASPPVFTAEVTMRANAHTTQNDSDTNIRLQQNKIIVHKMVVRIGDTKPRLRESVVHTA